MFKGFFEWLALENMINLLEAHFGFNWPVGLSIAIVYLYILYRIFPYLSRKYFLAIAQKKTIRAKTIFTFVSASIGIPGGILGFWVSYKLGISDWALMPVSLVMLFVFITYRVKK